MSEDNKEAPSTYGLMQLVPGSALWQALMSRQEDQRDGLAAVVEFHHVTRQLLADVAQCLGQSFSRPESRRNFVRALAALFEGNTYCLRKICLVKLKTTAPRALSSAELETIVSGRSKDAETKIRHVLNGSYKLFEISAAIDAKSEEWKRVEQLLARRHRLVHPNTVADLEVTDDESRGAILTAAWLREQFEVVLGFITSGTPDEVAARF